MRLIVTGALFFVAIGFGAFIWLSGLYPSHAQNPREPQKRDSTSPPPDYSGISSSQPLDSPSSSQSAVADQAQSGPLFGEPAKQEAFEAYRDRAKAARAVAPPQIDPVNQTPEAMAGEINGFVDELGRKTQARIQAKEALRDLLSAEEQKRVERKLQGEETQGSQ